MASYTVNMKLPYCDDPSLFLIGAMFIPYIHLMYLLKSWTTNSIDL